MRLSRFVAASFCVLGVTAFWVIKAQLVQSIESSGFSQPLFLSWAFTSCYSVLLIPALIWLWTRNQCAAQEVIIKQTVRSAFLLSFLYSLTSWLFNLSLSHTAVATNTIIGNLSCAAAFILSALFLRERVSTAKLTSLGLSVIGVILIGLYPTQTVGTPSGQDSAVGILAAVLSTILYALFEVLYTWLMYPEQRGLGSCDEDSCLVKRWRQGGSSRENSSHFERLALQPLITSVEASNLTHLPDFKDASQQDETDSELQQVPLENKAESEPTSVNAGPSAAEFPPVLHSCLFLGALGLATALCLWPLLLLAHLTGLELFILPDSSVTGLLFLTSGADTLMSLSVILGVALSSPVFISVGSLLSIPASIVSDKLLHSALPSSPAVVGVVLIVLGFLGIQYGTRQERLKKAAAEAAENEAKIARSREQSTL